MGALRCGDVDQGKLRIPRYDTATVMIATAHTCRLRGRADMPISDTGLGAEAGTVEAGWELPAADVLVMSIEL